MLPYQCSLNGKSKVAACDGGGLAVNGGGGGRGCVKGSLTRDFRL